MKVCKFGGSSLSNAAQVEKVCRIVQEDTDRKIIVVSAPGKSKPDDIKITDLLIECAALKLRRQPVDIIIKRIIGIYRNIAEGFDLGTGIIDEIETDLLSRSKADNLAEHEFMDSMKAAGEDNSAKLIAACMRKRGINAVYVNPRDAGMLLSDVYGNTIVLEKTFLNLAKLRDSSETIVFPGFFGFTETGKVITFPRGGSDITGAIIAAAVKADIYENYTDVDYVYSADPRIVNNPKPINFITYREMRELSYTGFNVLQDETLIPVERANIPIHLLNTNNTKAEGTYITGKNTQDRLITGVASTKNFCIITLYKQLMNKELGFFKNVIDIFYDEKVLIEHIPTSVDSLSLVIREEQLSADKLTQVVNRLKNELCVDELDIRHGIALIATVGENMNNHIGILAKICGTISQENINIIVVCQGASQNNIIIGVKNEHSEAAVKAIYNRLIK
jgi:aspartate kinase